MKLGCMFYSLGRSLVVRLVLRIRMDMSGEGVDISAWHVTQYTHAEVK